MVTDLWASKKVFLLFVGFYEPGEYKLRSLSLRAQLEAGAQRGEIPGTDRDEHGPKLSNIVWIYGMGVGTGGTGGTCPPIILPSEIFLTQYALFSRIFAHKMFIFNKIFRLASLADQDTSN